MGGHFGDPYDESCWGMSSSGERKMMAKAFPEFMKSYKEVEGEWNYSTKERTKLLKAIIKKG